MNNLESLSSEIQEKVGKALAKISRLADQNEDLEKKLNVAIAKNLDNEEIIESMKEKYKALKIASAITGSDSKSIEETKIEINSLIREVDYCISQLSD
ncbi:MAG: hypothetical protein CMC37_02105 [Flavobacteriaceae bacterium]|nr:hypothetical protein [Flavobacteriaceae bacterium]